MPSPKYDAIVIGSGPNGLSAAIVLAQAGWSVLVREAGSLGGAVRTAELTLPGFLHDVCSSVYPMAVVSPFFQTLPLTGHGLEWVQPEYPLAHPFEDGTAVVVNRSVEITARGLGRDADAYGRLIGRYASGWDHLQRAVLAPPGIPPHPFAYARFGLDAVRAAASVARSVFETRDAQALFAGHAAHSMLPLETRPSAAFGLVLGITAHVAGWPFARGGAQRISEALASCFRSFGGEIVTDAPVNSVDELPPARAVLCDLTPKELLRIAGHRFPTSFRNALARYRFGPGTFKVDWALRGPVPWKNHACLKAGTLHLGGPLEEISAAERDVWSGRVSERPFLIFAQPSLFDPTRAPGGHHTAWAYCHVPNGSTADMTERIEMQVERFAPGFRDQILARHVISPAWLEAHNANLAGGDINGGAQDLPQLFLRPTRRLYSTPAKGIYICSAATPPGGGVHGMCGYFAAQTALRRAKAS